MNTLRSSIKYCPPPAVIALLIAVGWYVVLQQGAIITQTTIAAYQQSQLEIVRGLARSIDLYVADRLAHGDEITQIEQGIFRQFIAPVRLLDNGDAWIYAPNYVVFDLSSDFPEEYRGKSITEIFALQVAMGASHYEEMAAAVTAAREGVGWYIWLPEKGREIAAWAPVRVGPYTWTIGVSTPLPEILASSGVDHYQSIMTVVMALATLVSVLLVAAWMLNTIRGDRAERTLLESEQRHSEQLELEVTARTAELLQANCNLQDEIVERKRTEQHLIAARDAAEVANRAKSAFLANMSHELRTPLHAIMGYTQLLIAEVDAQRDQELLPDLKQIFASSQQLLHLINDLLDLAKIEAGRMEPVIGRANLADLVTSVAATVRPLIDEHDNRFVVEIGGDVGEICTDTVKVQQVLLNLLSNAAKFTQQGVVTLRVTKDAQQLRYHFAVEDTGIGIATDQLELIFGEFTQVDTSTTRKYGGTGLGLAISRRYAQLLGGGIIAQSTVGAGSCFTFFLPASSGA